MAASWACRSSAVRIVGAYSTALLEGLAFGLDTCVVTLPGHRQLAFLYERGLAHRVDDVDALFAVLEAPAHAPLRGSRVKPCGLQTLGSASPNSSNTRCANTLQARAASS